MRQTRLVFCTLLVGALLLVPSLVQAATAIPSLPTDLLSEPFEGTPATKQPIAHPSIPTHPYLSPTGTNSMHNDAYASDAYTVSGPLGRNLQVRSATYGVSECATMAFDSEHRIIGLCGGAQGFTMRLLDPTSLEQIASLDMPARDLTSGANPTATA